MNRQVTSKRVRIWVLFASLVVATLLLTGCTPSEDSTAPDATDSGSATNEPQETEDTQQIIMDFWNDMLSAPYVAPIEYENVPTEAYGARAVIEAIAIYDAQKNGQYEQYIMNEPKYGVELFKREDAHIPFSDLASMKTVMTNDQFQKDYEDWYGIKIPAYYYLPEISQQEFVFSDLLTIDGCYYFVTNTAIFETEDNPMIVLAAFDTDLDFSARDVAATYAELDGIEVNTGNVDGREVYYLLTPKNCMFLRALRIQGGEEISVVYIWEQDGVIGVVQVNDTHKEKYLEWCNLVQYSFSD